MDLDFPQEQSAGKLLHLQTTAGGHRQHLDNNEDNIAAMALKTRRNEFWTPAITETCSEASPLNLQLLLSAY